MFLFLTFGFVYQDRFWELCRQVVDEEANRWQQALPVRNESRDYAAALIETCCAPACHFGRRIRIRVRGEHEIGGHGFSDSSVEFFAKL